MLKEEVIHMAEESYREFICSRIGPGCDFWVRAKTDEEVMEHAKRHMESSHGKAEAPAEMERKIKENIKPVKVQIK